MSPLKRANDIELIARERGLDASVLRVDQETVLVRFDLGNQVVHVFPEPDCWFVESQHRDETVAAFRCDEKTMWRFVLGLVSGPRGVPFHS